jgi:hypothetical protein
VKTFRRAHSAPGGAASLKHRSQKRDKNYSRRDDVVRRELERKDSIIMFLTQRITELEALQEASGELRDGSRSERREEGRHGLEAST